MIQTIPTSTGSDLVVPMGFAFSGMLDVLGQQLAVDAAVSFSGGFYIFARMTPLDVKGIIQITRSKHEKTEGPSFLVDLNRAPPRALVQINGYASIPFLQLEAGVNASLTSEGVAFSAATSLFGIWQSELSVGWGWSLAEPRAHFSASVTRTSGGVLAILAKVLEAIQHVVQAAQKVIDDIQSNIEQAKHYLAHICEDLRDHGKIDGLLYEGCRVASGALRGALEFFIRAAETILDAAAKIVRGLISAALKGMDIMDNLFSIQKYGLSGQLDGTVQGTKISAMIDFTLLGQQRSLRASLSVADVASVVAALWDNAGEALRNLGNAAKQEFEKVVNALPEAVEKAVDNLKNRVACKKTELWCGTLHTRCGFYIKSLEVAEAAKRAAAEAARIAAQLAEAAKQKALELARKAAAAAKSMCFWCRRRRRSGWRRLVDEDDAEVDLEDDEESRKLKKAEVDLKKVRGATADSVGQAMAAERVAVEAVKKANKEAAKGLAKAREEEAANADGAVPTDADVAKALGEEDEDELSPAQRAEEEAEEKEMKALAKEAADTLKQAQADAEKAEALAEKAEREEIELMEAIDYIIAGHDDEAMLAFPDGQGEHRWHCADGSDAACKDHSEPTTDGCDNGMGDQLRPTCIDGKGAVAQVTLSGVTKEER
jgi:hypothetical protein